MGARRGTDSGVTWIDVGSPPDACLLFEESFSGTILRLNVVVGGGRLEDGMHVHCAALGPVAAFEYLWVVELFQFIL